MNEPREQGHQNESTEATPVSLTQALEQAKAEERQRIWDVMQSEEAIGRQVFALFMCCKHDFPVAKTLEILRVTPSETRRDDFADFMRRLGATGAAKGGK